MARLNVRRAALPPQGGVAPRLFEPSNTLRTHEGAPAAQITPELALRRSVCSCLLWESGFYESGEAIADRITDLAAQVPSEKLAELAADARSRFNLRHVPLLLCAILARTAKGKVVRDTIAETIQRPDELTEFLAVYAKLNNVTPDKLKPKLSAQVKRGLAAAFGKFDAYQLAKYFSASGERDAPIKGRDAMFLVHPKPANEEQVELYRKLAAKEPIVAGGADTWEVALSSGKDKRETFEALLRDGKLGYLALLRNLRNMASAHVDRDLVANALLARRGARRVLPFRYLAAARAVPDFGPELDQTMRAAIAEMKPLPGHTIILVDVSGSMDNRNSARSDLTRMDAAAALAAIVPGNKRVFTFSDRIVEVNAEPGLTGISAIINSQSHQGTYLGAAVAAMPASDRLIVITDEQSHDHVGDPKAERAYLINVASDENGIGYGPRWLHLDGFSEQVIRFIAEFEGLPSQA